MPHSRNEGNYADNDSLASWRAASIAWLERYLGRDDAYTRQFAEAADGWYYSAATAGTAILRHVKADVENGYLRRYTQLVAAELVADVWEQASTLLNEGYKEAAASISGAALEVGLRRVAADNAVEVGGLQGIGPLNTALAKAGVYSAVRRQQVDAWRTLRNAAAHGEHEAYTSSDVRAMLDGVQRLLADLL